LISELLDRPTNSNDYGKDGSLYKVCPYCYSVDNASLREDRHLVKSEQKLHSIFSRRDKKRVIHSLCTHLGLDGEQRHILASESFKKIKKEPDVSTIFILATFFEMEQKKIEIMFHNIKLYRRMMKNETNI